jgi:hypothetical protein
VLTIPADKMLRLGDVAVNLAHVAVIRFRVAPEGTRRADLTLAVPSPGGSPDVLAFEGESADELYEYFGGPFDG